MQSITANDQAVALSDAFRCLVKILDKSGVLRLADLEKAMQVKADSRREALLKIVASNPKAIEALHE